MAPNASVLQGRPSLQGRPDRRIVWFLRRGQEEIPSSFCHGGALPNAYKQLFAFHARGRPAEACLDQQGRGTSIHHHTSAERTKTLIKAQTLRGRDAPSLLSVARPTNHTTMEDLRNASGGPPAGKLRKFFSDGGFSPGGGAPDQFSFPVVP